MAKKVKKMFGGGALMSALFRNVGKTIPKAIVPVAQAVTTASPANQFAQQQKAGMASIPQAINTAGKVQQNVGGLFGNAIAEAMKKANIGKKNGGTTTLHSITKSNKKSNW